MLRFLNRFAALLAVIGFGLAALWLLWADRGTLLGDRIMYGLVDAGRTFERTTMIDLVDRRDIPASMDQIGHAMLWAVGAFVLGWFRLGRDSANSIGLMTVGLEVALLSLLSEFAQPLVSTNRGFEASDAVANLVGVSIGTTALAMLVGGLRLARTD